MLCFLLLDFYYKYLIFYFYIYVFSVKYIIDDVLFFLIIIFLLNLMYKYYYKVQSKILILNNIYQMNSQSLIIDISSLL